MINNQPVTYHACMHALHKHVVFNKAIENEYPVDRSLFDHHPLIVSNNIVIIIYLFIDIENI